MNIRCYPNQTVAIKTLDTGKTYKHVCKDEAIDERSTEQDTNFWEIPMSSPHHRQVHLFSNHRTLS